MNERMPGDGIADEKMAGDGEPSLRLNLDLSRLPDPAAAAALSDPTNQEMRVPPTAGTTSAGCGMQSPPAPLTFQKTDRHGFTIGSAQYTDPELRNSDEQTAQHQLRKRELKWLKMFSFWEMTINENFKMVFSEISCQK